ncbi:hypothetical protein [Krasilnikovia sp. M28-CT-15]|uniref:hypothetical protein n=1 Tax=Krasilnikovia sp. M28-CT-15 TaxID=3373540 RepID=UPI003875F747
MAATALSFKGHAAYLAGQPGAVVTLSEAARRDPTVYIGQRAYDALQAARGRAMLGETSEVLGLLSLAADEDAETAAYAGPVPDWHYYRTPEFFLLERGLVYAHLGRATDARTWDVRAVESLSNGLGSMPADMRESEWTADYLLALAAAQLHDGDRDSAVETLRTVRRIATSVGSRRLVRRTRDSQRIRRGSGSISPRT